MSRQPARVKQPGVDPRVAGWAEQTLERASLHPEAAGDLTAEITRHADALAAENAIPGPRLLAQVVAACHAAIALVLVTDYRRAIRLDPGALTDPASTAEAVKAALADLSPELRPDLARKAATKIAVHSAAVD
jgi:hypothetical protein